MLSGNLKSSGVQAVGVSCPTIVFYVIFQNKNRVSVWLAVVYWNREIMCMLKCGEILNQVSDVLHAEQSLNILTA